MLNFKHTLQIISISEMDFRVRLAAAMISSCLLLIPADTALAVAVVIDLVQRTKSSATTPGLHPSLE